jgi:hypothetical protein
MQPALQYSEVEGISKTCDSCAILTRKGVFNVFMKINSMTSACQASTEEAARLKEIDDIATNYELYVE